MSTGVRMKQKSCIEKKKISILYVFILKFFSFFIFNVYYDGY